MFTIYALLDPRDYTVRYVGMSSNVYKRFIQHLRCDGNNLAKDAWIRELQQVNQMVIMQTIGTAETREEALHCESQWIKDYLSAGTSLFNHTARCVERLPQEAKEDHIGIEIFQKIGAVQRRRYEEVSPDGVEPIKEVVLFRHLFGQYWPGLSRDMMDYYDYFYFTKPNRRKDGEKYTRHLKCWERRTRWITEHESTPVAQEAR